jgi:hypothetical protein
MKEKFDPTKTFPVTITLDTKQVALIAAAITRASSTLREANILSDYDENGTDERIAKEYDKILLVFINKLAELAAEADAATEE